MLKHLLSLPDSCNHHYPWPRSVVDTETWRLAASMLKNGDITMLGLWAEANAVHLAVAEPAGTEVAVLTLPCQDGRFPSIAQHHAPAIRLERTIQDLFGLQATGLPDPRVWLDHGCWQIAFPAGGAQNKTEGNVDYEFLSAEGESLHQLAVGPVHAGIIEPGHFRFTASGEIVVRLEERLGYTHKGTEHLMEGKDLQFAGRLAGRVSGDSTVAYAWAYARAVESALNIEVPARGVWLRALMAELERLANHIGDIGAICNDAAFALMHAQCSVLREYVLRACNAAFGHRLMMDKIIVAGVDTDVDVQGQGQITALLSECKSQLPDLIELYDKTSSLEDRTVGTGKLATELVQQFACGGYIGRASGRAFDARKQLCYSPYDELDFEIPVRNKGDVNARIWIRFDEISQSLSLIEQILERIPTGPVSLTIKKITEGSQGLAIGEGFRGDILVWVSIDGQGLIKRCHLRDPSWFQWPLLEIAIKDNFIADFPLCNKSFNCSYSGHDL